MGNIHLETQKVKLASLFPFVEASAILTTQMLAKNIYKNVNLHSSFTVTYPIFLHIWQTLTAYSYPKVCFEKKCLDKFFCVLNFVSNIQFLHGLYLFAVFPMISMVRT